MKRRVQEPTQGDHAGDTLKPAAQRSSGTLWSLLPLGEEPPAQLCQSWRKGPGDRKAFLRFFFFPSAAVNYSWYSNDLVLGKGFPVHYLLISSEGLHFFLFSLSLFLFPWDLYSSRSLSLWTFKESFAMRLCHLFFIMKLLELIPKEDSVKKHPCH